MSTAPNEVSIIPLTAADGIRRINRRERLRNEGRFRVKERLLQKKELLKNEVVENNWDDPEDVEDVLIPFIEAIGRNDVSAFGIHKLALLSDAIDAPFSLTRMIAHGMIDLSKSKASKEAICSLSHRLEFIQHECENYGGITLLTLASLYGRVSIVGKLLRCGADPTVRGRNQMICKNDVTISVLQIIADEMFPATYAAWAVRCTTEMRLHASVRENLNMSVERCQMCENLFTKSLLLSWRYKDSKEMHESGHHRFCEECWWNFWSSTVYGYEQICCPICFEPWPMEKDSCQNSNWYIPDKETKIKDRCLTQNYRQRKEDSLQRFLDLPETVIELKKSPKKISLKDRYDKTWREYMKRSQGKTKDVRIDKFLSAVSKGAVRYVLGCLEAGVDVDVCNEYGQSSLFIAAWKGFFDIVDVLLQFGANVFTKQNGGMQINEVARANGHRKVAQIVEERMKMESINGLQCQKEKVNFSLEANSILSSTREAEVKVLIDASVHNHPGAGSVIIDYSIPNLLIEKLLALSKSLPADKGKKIAKGTSDLCSIRSYYCDTEGFLINAIRKNISPALIGGNPNDSVDVFPHMRFLSYFHQGSKLSRHIDLCRVDDSGQRSTHSFLLYLSDCTEGGETILFDNLTSDDNAVRVKPRKGRLLLFPHKCPHEGNIVVTTPKVLIRGEAMINRRVNKNLFIT